MPNSPDPEYQIVTSSEPRSRDECASAEISWEQLRLTAQFGDAMISMASLYPQRVVWKPV